MADGETWPAHDGEISPLSGFNSQLQSAPGEAGNLFFTGCPGPSGWAHRPVGISLDMACEGAELQPYKSI
jgi:hypothetical protein